MPTPLDPATLPRNVTALRSLLLRREAEHAATLEQRTAEQERQAAELQAARNGLQELTVLRNEQLKLRLAQLLRERFGASSEKLRAAIDQLELLLDDLEEQIAETTPPEPKQSPASAPGETTRRKPVRRPLAGELAARCGGACRRPAPARKCGGALRPLGEDVTEVLDYVPATFRVIRHVRPKLSCRDCESIAQAPVPEPAHPAWPGHAWAAVACAGGEILLTTCRCIARPRSTLAPASSWIVPRWPTGLVRRARLLRPLVDAVGAHVMAAERVHADDTTVPVLDPGRGTTKTGRLWCYVRDDRPFAGAAAPAVMYHYSPDRKGEHPRSHLASFHGILQADGYAGYAGLYERDVTEAACLGACAAEILRRARRHPVAAGVGGFATHRRTVCDRGRRSAASHPMPAWLPRQAKSAPLFTDLQVLAGGHPDANIGQERSGRGDPLHAVALGCIDTGAARRSSLHRQQRRRTRDAADDTGAEKLAVRRCRRWRVILPIWRCPYKVSRFCRGS